MRWSAGHSLHMPKLTVILIHMPIRSTCDIIMLNRNFDSLLCWCTVGLQATSYCSFQSDLCSIVLILPCSEADVRQAADTAEAQDRKEADTAEAQSRETADAAELQARRAGDEATLKSAQNHTDALLSR